ncbi:phosphate transporter PHO1 9-like [Salvia divinorum]|uniref:Phosphate transporter PHO1 9-like n=1 Tax=Salvia divinorum TaxID=28513 RepID=A0ABD1HL33_SALDI
MKFAEELASQMVQEWQAAYMDYSTLKQALKNLVTFRQQRAATPADVSQRRTCVNKSTNNVDDTVITVQDQNYYQEGGRSELEFFTILDDEFNKVVNFYKDKLQQLKVEAHDLTLKNQVGVHLDIIQQVELRRDYIKIYKQVRHLRSFCSSNILAFSKIMYKYDKIASRTASNVYFDMLDNSFRATSNEVYELMERLEAAFIEQYAEGNSRKGKKFLRLGGKREKHRTTFLLGCSIALAIAIIVSMHARDLLNHTARDEYMESIFPLYSLFGFIVLHLLMYGSNAYLRRRFRVNYPSILGFKEETDLGFKKVLLLASALSVLSLAAVLSNLDMEMDLRTMKYSTLTELVPLALVLLVLLVTFCPLNILYHSSRFFFLRHVWHCASAPLHKGTFTDFFLADQLTSQVQAIRSLLFYVFYYTMGDFTTRSNAFLSQKSYKALYIVVAIIPSWWRLLQCLRRFYEEKEQKQGLNALKYLSTIMALAMRTMYDQKKEELLISNKAVYFFAIVVNMLLRLVSVLDFNETEFLHKRAVVALVACLEILRRGIWNFFRLENEHFHQVGKGQAHDAVLLPS